MSPKATDGVWAAGMRRRKLAAPVVQRIAVGGAGPYPIRPASPATFPGKAGEGTLHRARVQATDLQMRPPNTQPAVNRWSPVRVILPL